MAGLLFYLRAPAGRAVRALGWAFVLLFALFAAGHAKPCFLMELYPALFAAGAVRVEARLGGAPGRWLRPAYSALVVLGAAALAPIVMPLLPPAATAAYSAPLHVGEYTPQRDNPIVQPLADRFGWPGMVATVAAAYAALPAAQRPQACILAGNYGEAGAVGFFGPAAGLPPAISPHNNFYIWGPGGCGGTVVLRGHAAAGPAARVSEHPAGGRGALCVLRPAGERPPGIPRPDPDHVPGPGLAGMAEHRLRHLLRSRSGPAPAWGRVGDRSCPRVPTSS